MKNQNTRPFTDKDLIVFLVARKFEIKDIKKDPERKRSIVYFQDSKELDKAILSFTNRDTEANVNVSEYIAAEKRVKTLLMHQKVS